MFSFSAAGSALALALSIASTPSPVVGYTLDVELDPRSRTISGEGTVTWRNTTAVPVGELWWHLYLNAFRNDLSTLMRESNRGRLRKQAFERPHWGSIEVTSMTLGDEGTDLLAARTFEHPDDDNAGDRTVMRTPLPAPVAPGATIRVAFTFASVLPKVFARTGWGGDFIMVAQFFPKLGVINEDGSWNCHQFHATTEFFANFTDFRANITVPKTHQVGAVGKRVAAREHGDKVTYEYVQDRVHDFAFAADPRFVRLERDFDPARDVTGAELAEAAALLGRDPRELQLQPIKVIALLQPEHVEFADRYYRALFAAIRWFGLWYGPYPYETLTLIDGPRVAMGAMGMEYPTLITGGVAWPAPEVIPVPESVTVHEFGHQYWYGLVATNEFESSWLDEGFTTYSHGKVLDRAYGPWVYAPAIWGFPTTPWISPLRLDHETVSKIVVLDRPPWDRIDRPAWDYRNTASYTANSYHKPALMLRQLEKELGEQTMARAMREYFERFRFRHPAKSDFVRTIEEVAGRPMTDYFRRTLESSGEVDYAITELTTRRRREPAGIFDGQKQVTEDQTKPLDEYETTVFVERLGEITWPVEIEVSFEDQSTERRTWDGEYRWTKLQFTTRSPALVARLDPDDKLLLDTNALNDSKTTTTDVRAAIAWGAHALYLAQTLLHVAGGWW